MISYNFGSGPGIMPPEVLLQAQQEMFDCNGSGVSIMEMPFTDSSFQDIADQARQDLRQLLQIPDNFEILFMQGGASAQFALVPMNLIGATSSAKADYIDSGYWSAKAIREAKRYLPLNVVAGNGTPEKISQALNPKALYCHITTNETADGIQMHQLPDTGDVPLVADMSSDFLSRPIDFQRFGVIYAGAQKNIGPAGLTIVLVRQDMLRSPIVTTPSAFSYQVIAQSNGRFNTPLTHAIYIAGLVFKHLLQRGGVEAMATLSKAKSRRLYQAIDRNNFYHCHLADDCRSRMNVCFDLPSQELTELFITQARQQGLINLSGHSIRKGIRASLYNAMPMAGVAALENFMTQFASQYQDAL